MHLHLFLYKKWEKFKRKIEKSMMLKPILRKFEPVVQADLTEEREMILNRRDRNCIFFLGKNRKILKKKILEK